MYKYAEYLGGLDGSTLSQIVIIAARETAPQNIHKHRRQAGWEGDRESMNA